MEDFKIVELGKKEVNDNSVVIYTDLNEYEVLAVLDKTKIYELKFENGYDLVRIYGREFGGVAHCKSILQNGVYADYKLDIRDMLKNGKIKETYYEMIKV